MVENLENTSEAKIEPAKEVVREEVGSIESTDKKVEVPEGAGQSEDPNWKALREDPNWRAMREARKKDKADREAAERRLKEKEAEAAALKDAMEAILARGQYAQQVPQQNYHEDTVEEQIRRKVDEALASREAAYERDRIEREKTEYPQRLVKTYTDFNSVVTEDNLDYLEYHYPEVASLISKQQDGYDKWSDTYKALKRLVPNSGSAKKDAQRVEINSNKPRSTSSPTMTHSGEPGGSAKLSDERKAENWARMQKLLKGMG